LRHKQHTNNSTGYAMTTSSNAVRSIDHRSHLNEVPPASPACVIHFFEARHRLLADSVRVAQASRKFGRCRSLLTTRRQAERDNRCLKQKGYRHRLVTPAVHAHDLRFAVHRRAAVRVDQSPFSHLARPASSPRWDSEAQTRMPSLFY
jgi:hypothetical protein